MIKILENLPTYLTMPYPRLAMITRILARVLFTAESTSANATAPGTAGGHRVSLRPPPLSQSHRPLCLHPPPPSSLTRQAVVADALELGVVDGLLQHAQEDDSPDPELDPEQIPPVASQQSQPQHGHQHVHDAHGHVELETTSYITPIPPGRRYPTWARGVYSVPRACVSLPSSWATQQLISTHKDPSCVSALQTQTEAIRSTALLYSDSRHGDTRGEQAASFRADSQWSAV